MHRSAISSVRAIASRQLAEQRLHLGRRLEVELVGLELPVVRVGERVARLDAEQRLVRPRVLVAQVVDVAGRDERDARRSGERDEPGVDLLLDRQPGVLELDVDGVPAEDLDEAGELRLGVLLSTLLERLADAAGETAGERDDAVRVGVEQLPVDARLVVVALEIAGRDEPDQVRVALVRLGEQREVRVALRPAPSGRRATYTSQPMTGLTPAFRP